MKDNHTRELLNGDNIDIIIKDAISDGWIKKDDGSRLDIKEVSDEDKYELMGIFIQFLIDTDKELESRIIIAKA